MLTQIHPKLPMRNKEHTLSYYTQLGFSIFGNANYPQYLMLKMDNIQVHFFEFAALNPLENYGQVYIRSNNIEGLYNHCIEKGIAIHPAGKLQEKPWGIKEFSLLDPDHNLLTFGEEVE